MMPPKKSKAARKAVDEDPPAETKPEPAVKTDKKDKAESGDEGQSQSDVNIFRVEVVEGKRARHLPVSESGLTQWLNENVEEKEQHNVVALEAYESYVGHCVASGTVAISQYEFYKALKTRFPNGSAIKEASSYFNLIRVKKPKKDTTDKGEKKDKKSKSSAPKFDMKEIVTGVLNDMGNPAKGVKFNKLKSLIAGKFPALQIENRPKFLLAYLERSARFGYIEVVDGIGKCGIYRLPGPDENEDETVKKETQENGDVDAENDDEKKEDTEDSGDKKDDKKDDKEDDKEAKEGDEQEKDEKKSKKKAKESSKKDKKKKTAPAKHYRSFVMHSDPQRVEDSFCLAMTYMVEPKEATARKVLKYLQDYYVDEISQERVKKCLETGCEKGYWEAMSGLGMSGRYRLLMDEFDPTADDDLTGQIMNALVACTEPKQCSASLLKGYMIEYHPEFHIAERPHLFKKAIERALNKNIILRLSGIGAGGSFQLYDPFTPTPLILKGEDREQDYESDSNDAPKAKWSKVEEDDGQGFGKFHISTFQDAYKPRPSKRKGHGRVASTGIKNEPMANKVVKASRFRSTTARTEKQTTKSRATGKPKYREVDSSQSEDEESEDESPRRKRTAKSKSSGRASLRKQKKKSYAVRDSSDSEDGDSVDEAPAPKRVRGPPTPRGEPVKKSKAKTPSKKEAPATKAAPARKGKGKAVKQAPQKKSAVTVDPSSAEEEDSGDESGPAPQVLKKGGRVPRQKPQSKESDSEEEDTPKGKRRTDKAATSRGRQSPQKNKRGMYTEVSSGEDEAEEERPPPKKVQKKTPAKKVQAKQAESSAEEDEPSEDETPRKKQTKTPTKKVQAKQAESSAEEEEPSADEAPPKKQTPIKKVSKKGKKGRRK